MKKNRKNKITASILIVMVCLVSLIAIFANLAEVIPASKLSSSQIYAPIPATLDCKADGTEASVTQDWDGDGSVYCPPTTYVSQTGMTYPRTVGTCHVSIEETNPITNTIHKWTAVDMAVAPVSILTVPILKTGDSIQGKTPVAVCDATTNVCSNVANFIKDGMIDIGQNQYLKFTNTPKYKSVVDVLFGGDYKPTHYRAIVSGIQAYTLYDSSTFNARETTISQGCCLDTLKDQITEKNIAKYKSTGTCLQPNQDIKYVAYWIAISSKSNLINHPKLGTGVCIGNMFYPNYRVTKYADGSEVNEVDKDTATQVDCCPTGNPYCSWDANNNKYVLTSPVSAIANSSDSSNNCNTNYFVTTAFIPISNTQVGKVSCVNGIKQVTDVKANKCLGMGVNCVCDTNTYNQICYGEYNRSIVDSTGKPVLISNSDNNAKEETPEFKLELWHLMLCLLPLIGGVFLYSRKKDFVQFILGFLIGSFIAILTFYIIEYMAKNWIFALFGALGVYLVLFISGLFVLVCSWLIDGLLEKVPQIPSP